MGAIIRGVLYPAKATPLLLIGIFSLLGTLANSAWIMGVPLLLMLVSWFLKYSFVMFDDITLGRAEPSVLSAEMVNPLNEQRPLGMGIIVAIAYGLSMLLQPLIGAQWSAAIRAAELILLPASAATLGITGRVLEALNPVTLLGVVKRMGLLYVGVVLAIAALAGAIFWVLLPHYGGSPLALAFSFALTFYGWLAMFSVLAHGFYERRTELDLESWYSPERSEAKARGEIDRDRDHFVDELYVHWRVKSYKNAWSALDRHLAHAANPTDDLLWIHERVTRWPDRGMATKIARDLLPRLLDTQRNSEALQLVRTELACDSRFRPHKSAELVRLIQLGRAVGDRATARKLLTDFEQCYPEDPASGVVAKLKQELAN